MIEQAIIMAGGEGRRLKPLTESRPKALMPLLDEPVIGMTLALLQRHGIRRVTITLRCMAQAVMDRLGDGSAYGVRLRYVVEDEPRGTAGSVRDAVQGMSGPALVMSGDSLTDCDLGAVCQAHEQRGLPFSIVVKEMTGDLSQYGVCEETGGRLTAFVEKPLGSQARTGLVSTGMYVLSPGVMDTVPADRPWDFARDMIPALRAQHIPIGVIRMAGYWRDIGTRDAYHQAQMDLLMGRVGVPVPGERRGHAIVAPGSRVGKDVQVTGRCYIGRNACVDSGAVLGAGTILSSGAHVGRNARLENTTLWENAVIDCGMVMRNVVVVPGRGASHLQELVLCGSLQARNAT